MEHKITGRIKVIMNLETFDSGFTKREFVITTQEQYPQDVKLELIKDRTSLLDNCKEGDTVTVSFNVRGNEYNGRYYVNLQAWKITPHGEQPAPPQQAPTLDTKSNEDDLPF